METKTKKDDEWVESGAQKKGEEETKGPQREAQEEQQALAEEEHREAQEAAAEHAARLGMVIGSVESILGDDESLALHHDMPLETQLALKALYEAKTGKGKDGENLAGANRSKLLNQALTVLRPVLSMAQRPEGQVYAQDLEIVREETAELRHDIRQQSLLEAHLGRGLGTQPLHNAEKIVEGVKLSELGSLAWELARLGRKKRKPFDHDPDEHPIVDALDTLARYALALGNIGARLAVLEARKQKLSANWVKLHGVLSKRLNKNRALSIETVNQFLRMVETDTGVTGDVGSHPVLAARFEDIRSKYSDGVTTCAEAIPAAIDIVTVIDACLDDHEKLIKAAEGGDDPDEGTKDKKKGWFRR